jgi:hypothetical protein
MKKDCEARLRGLVPTDEHIAAVGTAEELQSLGPDIGSGSGWTFVVVTTERVLFARWDSPQEPHEEIELNEVKRWASGTQYNREALVLTHLPMTRRERAPARKILWFEWPAAQAEITRTETIFRFSRPDTEVAKALHSALSLRGIAHTQLHFEEKPRRERIRGSHAVLRGSDLEPKAK